MDNALLRLDSEIVVLSILCLHLLISQFIPNMETPVTIFLNDSVIKNLSQRVEGLRFDDDLFTSVLTSHMRLEK
ncbi:unnamed protein product [Rodentolepis nana]|uniref:Surface presentation of antigens protein SpaK n=1 Tax=Rodentolepis nana TaxID=102285 RepID=A0A0R3TCB0_RODNA|nr:unnamed protein product [Rodentolepis nana]